MLNYIKANGKFIFFDDASVTETASAYVMACQIDVAPVFFRPPFHAGVWDELPIVGHRDPMDIAADMHHADHPVDAQRLIEESKHLDSAYAGRDNRPAVIVGLRSASE